MKPKLSLDWSLVKRGEHPCDRDKELFSHNVFILPLLVVVLLSLSLSLYFVFLFLFLVVMSGLVWSCRKQLY